MTNTTAKVKLPYIVQSQSQKEVTHNASLDIIDALLHPSVLAVGRRIPPEAPKVGDAYVTTISPEGLWKGHANALAFYTTEWNFIAPWKGLTVWASDKNLLHTYDGSAWILTMNQTSFHNLQSIGVNATADNTNRLSVASSGVLLSHFGSDIQVKINKKDTTHKASIQFQQGFGNRAEVGLLGDDNLTFQVSANGSTFFTSLKMIAANGRIALKSNGSALTANGSTQSNAIPITKQTNEFTSVAQGQGAILPSAEQGEFIFIANAGTNALNIYPATGHSINALSPNTPFQLLPAKNAVFWAATNTKWYANLSA